MRALWGVILTPATLFSTKRAATSALYLPTSDLRKRNCRFRLEMSIVSDVSSHKQAYVAGWELISRMGGVSRWRTHIYNMYVLEP